MNLSKLFLLKEKNSTDNLTILYEHPGKTKTVKGHSRFCGCPSLISDETGGASLGLILYFGSYNLNYKLKRST